MECNKVKARPCKIPSGNDFKIYIRVEKPNYETGETIWEPFDLSVCKNITVQLLNEPRNIYIPLEWALDDEDTSKIIANVEGLSLTPGSSYGMQITGIDSDGNNFRWKARGREMFSAVDATNDANLNEDLMDYLDVKVRIGFEYASEIFATKEELNVVSGEVDDLTTQVSTNTQNIESNTTTIAQNYATLTQSINDEARTRSSNDQALQSAITTIDDKFELYYPKTDVYNKTEIDAKVSTINGAIGSEESSRIAGDDNLQTQINTKANTADVYNKTSVNSLLADKANSADVYDKTETYNKDEVDELIEEAGGTTYTDTILVGTELINTNNENDPTAVFGAYNTGVQGELFAVGSGILNYDNLTDYIFEYHNHINPLQEASYTFSGSRELPQFGQYVENGMFEFGINGQIENKNNEGEFGGFGMSFGKFFIELDENHQFTKTLDRDDLWSIPTTFTMTVTWHEDTGYVDLDVECTSRLIIEDGNATRLLYYAKSIERKDALLVKSDGKTYINETGTSTETYALQDKINDIDDKVTELENNSQTFNIEDNHEYNSYLYHASDQTYVLKESEDLTPYESEYFTIEVLEDATDFSPARLNETEATLYWSTDKSTWTDAFANGITGTFTAGTKIYLKGTLQQQAQPDIFGLQYKFAIGSAFAISGNINSLIFGDNFVGQTDISAYAQAFQSFFDHSQGLRDASRLILPATTLSAQCYQAIFYDCSNLKYGPRELPATTLADRCYNEMFMSCPSLIKSVDILPAEELPQECYRSMYMDCPSLTKFPSIRALRPVSGAQFCLWGMGHGDPNVKYAELMLANQIFGDDSIDYHWINPSNVSNGTLVLNTANNWAETYPINDNYGIPEGWNVVYVDPANPEETNPTIIYDKTETYNKEEVDELIEEAGGGTTYTDTIVVGEGLRSNDITPTAKFGYFNNLDNNVFSVGYGSVPQTWSASVSFTPLNEKGKTFTSTHNYNMETLVGSNDQAFFINLTPNNTNKGYDDNDTEFTLNYNYYYPNFIAKFEDHVLKHTIKYRESAHPERNFDIDFTIEVDPSIPTTTFTLKTTRDIKLIQTPSLNRGNVTRKDALSVDSDGYVNILSAPRGSDNTTYRLQDKFSNIETSINNINSNINSLPIPNIEILSQTDYDNYLYHDPMKTYMIAEDEDLTSYKNEYFTIERVGGADNGLYISDKNSYHTIEYSTNKTTWTTLNKYAYIGLEIGTKVYFRGHRNSAHPSGETIRLKMNSGAYAPLKISGNIMSLLYDDNFSLQTSLADWPQVFQNLFRGNTSVFDISKLILPATTLSNNCYNSMFRDCSNLTYCLKELPATTLADACYSNMFQSCSSMNTTISKLPATTLVNSCYNSMFSDCSSLIKSPSIRFNGDTADIPSYAFNSMFYACSSLKYIEIMANFTTSRETIGSNWIGGGTDEIKSKDAVFVMNANSNEFASGSWGKPYYWQVVKVTPPTNS